MNDPYAAARRWLATKDDRGFGGRAGYNPVDRAIVDPILAKVLQVRNRGQAPADDAEADQLMPRFASSLHAAIHGSEAGRAAIEDRVRAWWDDPPVHQDGKRVVADLGVTPGRLERGARTGWLVAKSEHAEKGELRPEEVGRRLRDLRARYPDADAWEIRADVANGVPGIRRMVYRYDRVQDRIFVSRQGDAGRLYGTPPLGRDLDAVAQGRVSTRVSDLEALTATGKDWMY